MRRGAKVLLVAAGALLLVSLLGFVLVAPSWRSGLSVHADPPAVEVALARLMRRWAVPPELRRATNPVPPSAEALASGRAHFADHCAVCHGNDGRGQTDMGRKMYPKAPDMTLPATQELSDGALFATIENGIRMTGMPGWGDGSAESAYGSWTLVHFIRHLPEISPEELHEMERLNPMTRERWEQLRDEEAFLRGEDPAGHGH